MTLELSHWNAMTGRSLHDALLRILSDGSLREQLFQPYNESAPLPSDEWRVLRRVPSEQVRNMARFLARHYYGERIARLFRHIRRLAPQTGRDPLSVLNTPGARAVLDHAVLGSAQTAEELLALIHAFLMEDDTEIQIAFPYWRDLIRYHATMFRLESVGVEGNATQFPRRSKSAALVECEWNLPAILQRPSAVQWDPALARVPSVLLIASSADRRITALRCTPPFQRLFEAADGTRTVEELSRAVDCSIQEIEHGLKQMREIGAVQWKEPLGTAD